MTGRELYDKHARALKETRPTRYIDGHWRQVTFDGRGAPLQWDWVPDDERTYWGELAKAVTPRKKRS